MAWLAEPYPIDFSAYQLGNKERWFLDTYERAARILGGMAPDEINAPVTQVCLWLDLVSDYREQDQNSEYAESVKAIVPNARERAGNGLSDIGFLFLARDEFDGDLAPFLPWSKNFAVVTFVTISHALFLDSLAAEFPAKFTDASRDIALCLAAKDALEAVCYAEQLAGLEQREGDTLTVAEKLAREKIAERNRAAARQSHAATDRLIADCLRYYMGNNSLSYAEAARRYYAALPPESQRLLSKSNAERTLSQGISKLLKGFPKPD